jgi:hypothetical protein
VNLHGGGNGYYTPIAGGLRDGFTKRPEFYGMQFAGVFSGSTLVKSTLTNPSERLTAYAAEKDGHLLVALINKGTAETAVSLDKSDFRKNSRGQTGWLLTGPALESTQNVTLETIESRWHALNRISVPAHSAAFWSL